jgi:hypothetical protein
MRMGLASEIVEGMKIISQRRASTASPFDFDDVLRTNAYG